MLKVNKSGHIASISVMFPKEPVITAFIFLLFYGAKIRHSQKPDVAKTPFPVAKNNLP